MTRLPDQPLPEIAARSVPPAAAELIGPYLAEAELLGVTPSTREDYLYDDLPDAELARQEHRRFTAVLERFCQVLEVRDLLAQVVENADGKGEGYVVAYKSGGACEKDFHDRRTSLRCTIRGFPPIPQKKAEWMGHGGLR